MKACIARLSRFSSWVAIGLIVVLVAVTLAVYPLFSNEPSTVGLNASQEAPALAGPIFGPGGGGGGG